MISFPIIDDNGFIYRINYILNILASVKCSVHVACVYPNIVTNYDIKTRVLTY